MKDDHQPVMVNEVLSLIKPKDGGIYLDATFGAGGHTKAILSSAICQVYALDRDENTKIYANMIEQSPLKTRFYYHNGLFSQMKKILPANTLYHGILMDVGVSSMQIDQGNRGFSFVKDGPLTMTMGNNNITARDIVNDYNQDDLEFIISTYGEEKQAKKIAQAICHARKVKPIESSLELAKIIHQSLQTVNSGRINSATKTFQAIRMEVNNELFELFSGISSAIDLLKINGILVIICFHSLEIRTVKKFIRENSMFIKKEKINKYKNTDVNRGESKLFIDFTTKSLKPSREEIRLNPRSRSALIRAIKRIK